MRRAVRAVLVAAVRGRRPRGGPWAEAVLAEFDQTIGTRQAVSWAAGGLRVVWSERREAARSLPASVRIQRAIAVLAVAGLLAALVVNQFALTGRYIASGGLAPAFPPASRVLLDKVGFRLTGLRHGDVVEFRDSTGHRVLREVVGLPGETIDCREGRIHRDGVPLGLASDCAAVTVPPGQLSVLGDLDDPIEKSAVDGRVVGRIWPLSG
jgi:signal peptidase I